MIFVLKTQRFINRIVFTEEPLADSSDFVKGLGLVFLCNPYFLRTRLITNSLPKKSSEEEFNIQTNQICSSIHS